MVIVSTYITETLLQVTPLIIIIIRAQMATTVTHDWYWK